MEQLSDEKDIGHLIESYARGIMEVTNQKNIAFWITAQDQTWTSKFVAIEAQLVMNKPEPKWNARVIPDQDHLKMLGALDFGLYLHEGHMQDLDVPVRSD